MARDVLSLVPVSGRPGALVVILNERGGVEGPRRVTQRPFP